MPKSKTNPPFHVGQKIVYWTLAEDLGFDRSHTEHWWLCIYQCGAPSKRTETYLRYHATRKSSGECGCHGTRHGMVHLPEYQVWAGVLKRCISHKDYGLRGIQVCRRWQGSFPAFYKDMGPRPTPKHTIERINNDGNYEPSNCRWATRTEQANNKRSNRYVTIDGVTQSVSQWARELNIVAPKTALHRIFKGWEPVVALTTPLIDKSHRYQRIRP